MDNIIDHYSGFEGEPEIQFIHLCKNGDKVIIRMWGGYFDPIMNAVLDAIDPGNNGWTGLAYCYSAVEGWYDESPWQIPDISDAIRQFESVNVSSLNKNTQNVLNDILSLLKKAQGTKDIVWIAYE